MSALAWWFASIGYGFAGLLVGCRVATLLAWHMLASENERYRRRRSVPDGWQWGGGVFFGILAACAWPLVLAAFAARGWLFAPPRDVQMARLRTENERLERELEIR